MLSRSADRQLGSPPPTFNGHRRKYQQPNPPMKSPTCCSVSSYISSPWPTHMPPPHQLRFPLLQFYAAIPFDLPIHLRICFQQQLTPSTCAADHNPKVHTLADECLCHQAGCCSKMSPTSHQANPWRRCQIRWSARSGTASHVRQLRRG